MAAALSSGSGHDGGIGDWPPNLLARIATTIGHRRRQEDVASTALLYVIQADGNARRAVVADLARRAGLMSAWTCPRTCTSPARTMGKDGVPDIVGVDDSARARIVIRQRLQRRLQPRQIARYSTRVESGLPSVITVLAPERRVPRLLHEAVWQLADEGIDAAETGPVIANRLTAP